MYVQNLWLPTRKRSKEASFLGCVGNVCPSQKDTLGRRVFRIDSIRVLGDRPIVRTSTEGTVSSNPLQMQCQLTSGSLTFRMKSYESSRKMRKLDETGSGGNSCSSASLTRNTNLALAHIQSAMTA